MLKQIQAFLTALGKQPAYYQLNEVEWSTIAQLYSLGDEKARIYLVQGLQQHSSVNKAEIHECIVTQITIDSFNQKQLTAQNQAIENFAKRAKKCIPQIEQLKLERSEWLELIRRFNKQHSHRVTSASLFFHLEQIKHLSYQALVKTFHGEERPSRAVKRAPLENKSSTVKRRKYYEEFDDSPNLLILAEDQETKFLHSPLAKQGVRVTSLDPATPTKDHHKVYRTPGGSKVRSLWSRTTGNSTIPFFKPLTPSPLKVKIKGSEDKIKRKIPKLLFVRHETIHFQATLEKLEERQDSKRRIGQNQLTGASCQSVFAVCDENIIIESRGSKYHWSHMIAYFLGGEQSIDNLVPATAASNYNVLEVIEQFIAQKLIEDKIPSINITVEPVYVDTTNIPGKLIFTLDWEELGKYCSETTHIDTRSHQRITKSMLMSIKLVRNEIEKTNDAMEEEPGETIARKLF
ncbi:DNA/RNA non-specific endonuclease [Legionella brunensis]|uniref:Type VII secretion system protein EssD-like domain-containing protein n=1 Tax=Legionella brunensis TaxID=29422 RepID=A0A0W0S3K0_9GAMM|nr:DNA/RNA non-specific endonuclease [Legionella brunensis]KTC77882.1 hypothetical protein Lbru_2775 [Legionella brunensis]